MTSQVTIFDWDDTLFYTHDYTKKIPQNRALLQQLEQLWVALIKASISGGLVFIVTNGSRSWFDFSLSNHENYRETLISNLVILSARDLYGHLNDYLSWKYLCFRTIIEQFKPATFISIGDGYPEMYACSQLQNDYPNVIFKVIKMQDAPALKNIIEQLTTISRNWQKIYKYKGKFVVKPEMLVKL